MITRFLSLLLLLLGLAVLVRTAAEGIGGGLGLLIGSLLVLVGSLRLYVRRGPLMPGAFERILVPMKIGLIGEEVLGTAIKLADEHGSAITALHVVRVPLDKPMDAELIDAEERAEASLAEARLWRPSWESRSTASSSAPARSGRRSSTSLSSTAPI